MTNQESKIARIIDQENGDGENYITLDRVYQLAGAKDALQKSKIRKSIKNLIASDFIGWMIDDNKNETGYYIA